MMMSMQRLQLVMGCPVVLLLILGTCSFSLARNLPDDDLNELRRLYSSYGAYKRLRPSYDFGLGKRSLEEPASYEDTGSYYAAYAPYLTANANSAPGDMMDKRAAPQGMYSFGLGKRSQRYYGFGLGKRLENAWRGLVPPSAAMFPSYRQERRSKIYSFGLGKRQSPDFPEEMNNNDYNEFGVGSGSGSDKRSQTRQFSFGLGKRDTAAVEAASATAPDHPAKSSS